MTSTRSRARKTYSAQQLAAELGKTRQAVQQWKDAGCPFQLVDGVARFVLAEVVEWLVDRARQSVRNDGNAEQEAKVRRMRAEAELRELEVLEKRGALMPKELHVERVQTIAAGFAAVANGQLARFERDIIAAADHGEARKVTQRMTRALLEGANAMADALRDPDADQEETEDVEDAA